MTGGKYRAGRSYLTLSIVERGLFFHFPVGEANPERQRRGSFGDSGAEGWKPQASSLGLFPFLKIKHTSILFEHQIYCPEVNQARIQSQASHTR